MHFFKTLFTVLLTAAAVNVTAFPQSDHDNSACYLCDSGPTAVSLEIAYYVFFSSLQTRAYYHRLLATNKKQVIIVPSLLPCSIVHPGVSLWNFAVLDT